jgi:hypothetical protein
MATLNAIFLFPGGCLTCVQLTRIQLSQNIFYLFSHLLYIHYVSPLTLTVGVDSSKCAELYEAAVHSTSLYPTFYFPLPFACTATSGTGAGMYIGESGYYQTYQPERCLVTGNVISGNEGFEYAALHVQYLTTSNRYKQRFEVPLCSPLGISAPKLAIRVVYVFCSFSVFPPV